MSIFSSMTKQDDPYEMQVNAKFHQDYKTPDWYKTSGLTLDKDPDKMRAYFEANPEHYEDWKNVTSGGLSKFETGGRSLIKSNFADMSTDAQKHYAENPYDLLAAEGFGFDPSLARQAYTQGAASIGVNTKNGSVTDALRRNRWTPNGMRASNNGMLYAKTPFGAGYQSYLDAAGVKAENKPLPIDGKTPGRSDPIPPAYRPNVGGGGGSTNAQVNYNNATVEGRIKSLLATDENGGYKNPVVQQAANSAMQQFAGRGLLNSSMATEAAYQAAIAKALEIAGPDAQTYFAQDRANQDAINVFERDARGYDQENYRLSLDMTKFDKELQYRYDALKLDTDSQNDARALAHKYALEIETVKSVNSAYDLYLRRITDIDANPDYTAEVKAKMKNEAGKDFDLYAKTKGISNDMRLGDRFVSTANDKATPESPTPSVANTYEGGD